MSARMEEGRERGGVQGGREEGCKAGGGEEGGRRGGRREEEGCKEEGGRRGGRREEEGCKEEGGRRGGRREEEGCKEGEPNLEGGLSDGQLDCPAGSIYCPSSLIQDERSGLGGGLEPCSRREAGEGGREGGDCVTSTIIMLQERQ